MNWIKRLNLSLDGQVVLFSLLLPDPMTTVLAERKGMNPSVPTECKMGTEIQQFSDWDS